MAYYPTTPGYNPVSVPLNNGTFGNYQNGYAQSNYGSGMGPYQQPQNWYPNMYGMYSGSQTSVNNQNAQTSRILADNAAQTVALEQYLNPTPVPAYMVQNPNCCGNFYNGCGCGYNG